MIVPFITYTPNPLTNSLAQPLLQSSTVQLKIGDLDPTNSDTFVCPRIKREALTIPNESNFTAQLKHKFNRILQLKYQTQLQLIHSHPNSKLLSRLN